MELQIGHTQDHVGDDPHTQKHTHTHSATRARGWSRRRRDKARQGKGKAESATRMRDNDSEIVREQLTRKKIKFNIFLFRQKLKLKRAPKSGEPNANECECERREQPVTTTRLSHEATSHGSEPAKLSRSEDRWQAERGERGGRGTRRGSNTQNILHSIISVFIAPQCTVEGWGRGKGSPAESEQVYIQMRACTILRSWHWTWRRSGNGSQMRFILT